MFVLELVQNLALLVALVAAYRVVVGGWDEPSLAARVSKGVLFGVVAVVVMLSSVRAAPGVIIDGRSIILAVAGFAAGPLVATIAAVTAAVARLWIGGSGMGVGIAVIGVSALLGSLFGVWRRRTDRTLGFPVLWLFGLAVHVPMVLLIGSMPGPLTWIASPWWQLAVLALHPLATALVCRFLLDYEELEQDRVQLTVSRERMRLALAGAGLGSWDWDVRTNQVIFDDRWLEMLGFGPGELPPDLESWRRRVHPDDRAVVEAALAAHLRGDTATYETEHRLRHKSGKWVWVLDRGRVVDFDDGDRPLRAAGTHLDVTVRKEAELAAARSLEERDRADAALRESEARFRRLAENAADIIYRYRLLPEPGFEYVSPSATAMTGYTPEEHYADPELGFKLVHPDDRHLLVRAAAVPGEVREPLVLRWVHKSERVLWTEQRNVPILDEEGRVVAVEGIARDVSVEHEASEELRRREETMRLFIDHVPAALAMFDREMRYLAVSRRWREEFRVEGDVLGRSHYDVFPWIPERWRKVHQRGIEGEVLRSDEDRVVLPDGTERWTRWEIRPWHDREGVGGVVLFTENITEQKAAAAATRETALRLQASEERYRSLFENSHAAMLVVDPGSGRILDANPAASQFYGYSREVLRTLTAMDLNTLPREQVETALDDVVSRRRGLFRMRHRLADGEIRDVEVRSGPVAGPDGLHLISIVTDVTEQREAEAALRSREEDYRTLFASNPQMLWVYDLESLSFLDVNEAAIRHYGYSREEFLSMTIADIRPEEDVPALLRAVRDEREGLGEPSIWRHRRKDGSVRHVEIRSHTLAYAGRRAILVLVTDVTEWMLQEEQIHDLTVGLEDTVRRRTRELRDANEELEAFSYSVSHDLKAPLRAIDGYSAMLQSRVTERGDGEAVRLATEVRAHAQQMGSLIDDLLVYSRLGRARVDPREVDVAPMVEAILARYRELAPERRIEAEVGDVPPVFADPTLLAQALENVVGNAVKFTQPRPVTRIEISGRRADDAVILTVRDNGVGFDSRYQHKLFRVFERLHYPDEFEGTGVGLAIVKRIVERSGGEVGISSVLDEGTVVELTLPAGEGRDG